MYFELLKELEPNIIGKPGKLFTKFDLTPYVEEEAVYEGKGKNKKLIKVIPHFRMPLPSQNDNVNKQRAGGWVGSQYIRQQKHRLATQVESHLVLNKLKGPMLDYAMVFLVTYYPDFIKRDLTNVHLKDILDVLTSARIWKDDCRIVHYSASTVGVVGKQDTKYSLFIFDAVLSEEEKKRFAIGEKENVTKTTRAMKNS